MEEVFRDIQGYENKYQVSNLGRVKSLKDNHGNYREKIMKVSINSRGYLQVNLTKECKYKRKSVHILVANAFIPNPNKLGEVNHKDENKINNYAKNLEWCTRKYNLDYGTGNKRRSEKLSQKVYQYNLKKELIKVWDSTIQCKEKGYSIGNISLCCNGKRNKHKNSIWSYRPL